MICAWGITENGERALVSVRLGMREGKEDWLELGRDLTSRGLAAPRLVVADGAPGLTSAVEEIWPRADRQHCAVQVLISELEHAGYEAAARCLADDLDALIVHLRYPLRHRERWRSTDESVKAAAEFQGRVLVVPVLMAEVGGCRGVARRQGRWRNPGLDGFHGGVGACEIRAAWGRCGEEVVCGVRLCSGRGRPRAKRRFWD